MAKHCREGSELANGKTGSSSKLLFLHIYQKISFCLSNYRNDSSTVPVVFTSKILVYMYRVDILRLYERRQSQRLQRFDLELDAIFISVSNCNKISEQI